MAPRPSHSVVSGQGEGGAAGDMLWTPPADVRETSRIGAYLRWLRETAGWTSPTTTRCGTGPSPTWTGSGARSGTTSRSSRTPRRPPPWPSAGMPGARWFPGATLNYAENVLRMPGVADDDPVVIAHGADPRRRSRSPPASCASRSAGSRAGLRRLGVTAGDRVAAYAPNIPETYVLMLATASLGAIFSSCAPEFGTRSVTDRWQQIEPKVLVAVDGYRYGDKPVDRRAEVAAIRAALPSLRAHGQHRLPDPTVRRAASWLGRAGRSRPTSR